MIVATAITFMVAGYDTTGTTLAFACYQLAKNSDIQDMLRQEIEEVLGENTKKNISYNDLQGMTYLDQIISETLRFHNPVGLLQRVTSKDYKLPGTDLVLPKDTMVWFNIYAIHMDPKNYSEPHIFNPDNFSKEAKANRHP